MRFFLMDTDTEPHPFDSSFYSEAFQSAIKYWKNRLKQSPNQLEQLVVEEYGDLTKRLDRSELQDSVSVRNVLRCRAIANCLIGDNGEIHLDLLPELIQQLKAHLYSIGPNRQHDSCRQEHLLCVLCALRDDKDLVQLLRKISKPYSQKNADQLIRDTLNLSAGTAVTDAHTRRAALSAWLTYLRQNVGSCFATAPAILIHDAQPHAFLEDLNELLATGRLKRTFGGIEYSAPLSASWGSGELRKPCLVPREERFGTTDLWLSPGLMEAFTAVGILDQKSSPKERALVIKDLLQQLFLEWEGTDPYIFVSAEEVIEHMLLKELGLTKQDLIDYANRPREIIQGALLMQVPQSAQRSGGKGELCARYYVLFNQATIAFKQLADNALLKSWEYTVASFAETKGTFSRWNFYSSLGLNHDDRDGIGPCIYKAVQDQLDRLNAQVREYQEQFDQLYGQVRHLETRIRHVTSENEGQWLRSELRSLVNEFKTVQELRDSFHFKAQNMSGLFNLLVEIYEALFPKYFQEVYDADIHEVSTSPYDDSPAGFRLVYKFGRSNTSQWVPIGNINEFIEALVSFFIATETEIVASPHFEGLKDILGNIVSTIVGHVRTKEFLESALHRMAAVHHSRLIKNPLEHLDKVEKKPWVYTSGGSMEALVSCYFGLLQPPTSSTRWVESPIELLVFLIDVAKQMPAKQQAALARSRKPALLMHSPTHAFLFAPMMRSFQDLASSESFTYTWVRDSVVIPMQRFVANIVLDEAKMAYLISLLTQKIPYNFRPRFKDVFARIYGTMSPTDFRQHLVETMEQDRGLLHGGQLVLSRDEIDSLLYAQIPLISISQLHGHVDAIIDLLPGISHDTRKGMLDSLDQLLSSPFEGTVIGAQGLQNIVKSLLCSTLQATSLPYDYHKHIAIAAQKLGFAMPSPILFADTNWIRDFFGFSVNPGTGAFELWRYDVNGSEGTAMRAWSQWLDGSRREPPWGIYINPYEYLR